MPRKTMLQCYIRARASDSVTLTSRNLYSLQRDDGLMRSSHTQENLRSPSVLGGSGRPSNPGAVTSAAGAISAAVLQQQHAEHDDEIATEYAESDVLLGGTGSNGSSSGAGSAATNNIPRY